MSQPAFALPPEALDCITVDGLECQGCLFQREVIDNTSRSGEERRLRECWIEMPKCQCPTCNIYCGSEVIAEGEAFIYNGNDGTPSNTSCVRYYLDPVCNPCD